MKVKVSQLKEGCILAEDVQLHAPHPLMPKKLVIKNEHIHILKVFLVKEVVIEKMLITGAAFMPDEAKAAEDEAAVFEASEPADFLSTYLHTVTQYKKLFNSWQAGLAVDIVKLRELLLKLLPFLTDHSFEILMLHQYSQKEDYMYHHAVATGILSAFIAEQVKLKRGEVINIGLAGLLSDIGMAKVSPRIHKKQGPLTETEYEEVKEHPIHSYRMIKASSLLSEAVKIAVLQHHEHLDGNGYPMAVSSNKIHLYSRIITIADVYHAMTSDRVYAHKKSPFKVIESMLNDQFGHFDPTIIQILALNAANLSNGYKVRLSNSQVAEIIYTDEKNPTRPIVKIEETGALLQLMNTPNLFIEEIL